MDLLAKLIQGLSFVPSVVNAIENLLKDKPGEEKRNAALSFLEATLSMSQSLAACEITDEAKFREGLNLMVNGAVECLQASAWAKRGDNVQPVVLKRE